MNRRSGGGMGPNRSGGMRGFNQQPFQSNVSPWQGGGGGGGGSNMNPGLINQLSNPQQLALALTSLLQPQQQSQPQPLLSMNAGGGFGNDRRGMANFGGRRDFKRDSSFNRKGGNWRNDNRGNQGKRNQNQQKKKTDDKKPEKKEDNNASVDESKEEEGDAKRDWKDEKNTSESEKKDDDKSKEDKAGIYHGVPQHLLRCFICSKDMWDGESFQKHVKGKAHKQMMDSVEESFQITVNILRENMRLAEEKKMIELNRMQRLNKGGKARFADGESHCNMCDFKFLGKIMAHRRTEGHQRLKRFLHPDCRVCQKEFPSRMEWVDHRLTPEHLRELAKAIETKQEREDGEVIVKEEPVDLDLGPIMDETTEHEDDFPILELTDDLSNLQNRIPAFKKNRPVGTQSLEPFSGFACKLCHRSFMTEEWAQNHLKSRLHYYKFVEAIKNKYKRDEQNKQKEQEKKASDNNDDSQLESSQGESTMNDSEMYDPDVTNDDDEERKNGEESETEKQDGDASMNEVKEDAKVEQPSTARPKRTNVKNGAGPKSKKARN